MMKDPNEKEHAVESQWHHPILIRNGFEAVTKTQRGYVRSYEYTNASGKKIVCTTGVSSDYWTDKESKRQGNWQELDSYLKSLR